MNKIPDTIEGGSIICPYCLFDQLKLKYPKRIIIPDMHCPNDKYLVFRKRKGLTSLFQVKTDGSIWLPSPDEMFIMLRHRPRNSSYYRFKRMEQND